jgi:probable rRNA maturation factor
MATGRPEIEVQVNAVEPWSFPASLLEEGCRVALRSEEVDAAELSVTLLDDRGIQELNREYLGKDSPTDVLAFALQAPGEPVLGDIYIGFQQAARQASELGVSLDEELLRLAVHGTLHVLGHDHPEGDGRFRSDMFRRQEELVARVLGLRGS